MNESVAACQHRYKTGIMNGRLLTFLFLGVVGCGQPLPSTADPARARTALQSALDAWQKGEPEQSLQALLPPIHFNDPEWRGGKKLVKYQIESEQTAGQSWRCDVLLTVQAGEGKATPRRASYCIDTDPILVIVREP